MQFQKILSIASLALFLVGCGTNPASLVAPAEISCVRVPERITFSAKRGLFDYVWITSLEPGLYLSEKIDGEGVYFRGPGGTLSIGSESAPGLSKTHDGGFWIPNDPKEPPRVYSYISMAPAPVEKVPDDFDCSKAAYLKDPNAKGLSVVAMTVGGGLGGLTGRAMVPGSRVSYGQAGAAGAIAGGIIALVANAEAGNIMLHPKPEDAAFSAKLRDLANRAVVLKEVSAVTSTSLEEKK